MKEYLIDFGTMIVQASNEDEAYKVAKDKIQRGDYKPDIDTVIDNGEIE